MEIPDPPHQTVCSACGPLIWAWIARRSRWTAFVAVHTDRDTVRVHRCNDDPMPTWRTASIDPDPSQAERNRRGRALAVAHIAGTTPPDL